MQAPTIRTSTLPAISQAATPRSVRRATRLIVIVLPLVLVGMLFLRWTQYSHAAGRATAFDPVQRPQFVVSPIEGRVKKWFVVEGQKVRRGEPLVELVDNDPELLRRLYEEENQVEGQLVAVRGQIQAIESRITSLRVFQTQALAVERQQVIIAQNEVDRLKQNEIGAQATQKQAELDLPRVESLFKKGLESERNLEAARQRVDNAKAAAGAAAIAVTNATESLKRARENLESIRASTEAQINSEDATKKRAEGDVTLVERLRLSVESRIERQRQQFVNSPADGTIFRLLANAEAGGQLVRPGERLAVLVPEIKPSQPVTEYEKSIAACLIGGPAAALTADDHPGIVAELLVDGNDLPLVRVGDPVRLQFEGWPAVQFVGWPSVARGTFGGRVYLIDPTADDRNGRFRILVRPDLADRGRGPADDAIDPVTGWPKEQYLRQGVRAQGWVLFDNVPLWWELFRQLNGFPPTRDPKPKLGGGPLGPVVK